MVPYTYVVFVYRILDYFIGTAISYFVDVRVDPEFSERGMNVCDKTPKRPILMSLVTP